jgi:hypothetical protein
VSPKATLVSKVIVTMQSRETLLQQ